MEACGTRQMLRSPFLLALLILVQPISAGAQETGEMLRFDGHVNLSVHMSEEMALKRVGETLYRSPVSSESRPFRRVLINGLLPQLNPANRLLSQAALAGIVASEDHALFVARATDSEDNAIVGTVSLLTSALLSGVRARIEDLVRTQLAAIEDSVEA